MTEAEWLEERLPPKLYDALDAMGVKLSDRKLRLISTADGFIAQWSMQSVQMRDVVGNPFRPVVVDPSWLTPAVVSLAKQIYDSRNFSLMPSLSDALQDAGCEEEDILNHCRSAGPHVRGCWVVDLVLGKS